MGVRDLTRTEPSTGPVARRRARRVAMLLLILAVLGAAAMTTGAALIDVRAGLLLGGLLTVAGAIALTGSA